MTDKKKYPRLIIWIGCLIGYLFYGFGGILFLTFILPFSFILSPFGKLSPIFLSFTMRMYLTFLTRIFLPALQIYDIKEIKGFEQVPKDKPVIFVANHRGKLDAPLLLGILKNTAVVIKLKYASLPVYSTLAKRLDFISLDRHSRDVIEKAVIRAKEVLGNRRNLLVFPEGTRTSSKRLLPFKEFAFRIAREKDTDIVPIIIHSRFAFMAKNIASFFPAKKNAYMIRCLAPVRPVKDENPVDMAARVRQIMVKELNNIENNLS